jgi:hypothetical protein
MNLNLNEWARLILSVGLLTLYAFVIIYSMVDHNPDSELIIGRVNDLMLLVVGYWLGNSAKKTTEK